MDLLNEGSSAGYIHTQGDRYPETEFRVAKMYDNVSQYKIRTMQVELVEEERNFRLQSVVIKNENKI
jgi:hypothetical protein